MSHMSRIKPFGRKMIVNCIILDKIIWSIIKIDISPEKIFDYNGVISSYNTSVDILDFVQYWHSFVCIAGTVQ